MTAKKRTTITMGLVLLVGTMLAAATMASAAVGAPISDDGVVPIEYDGNVSCQYLGYDYGFKIEGQGGAAYTGTFPFDLSNGGIHTGGAPDDPTNSVTTSSDGFYLDWTSTLGIDAVIMKGGPDSNAYVYVPEDTADGGLASPLLDNGNLPAISHVEFCYDYELTATKTADAEYTRTYSWTIDKSVDPASHSGFAGDTFSSYYDVALDRIVTDSDFAVAGTIIVTNPTPFTVSFSVSDSVGGTPATPVCPTYTLTPGASTTCTYSAALAGKVDGTNTAVVTSLTSGVGGATASADYTFGDPTTTVGFPTVNVIDSVQGSLGSASGDTTFEYTDDFDCPSDPAMYVNGVYSYDVPNKATITETSQYDEAKVTVDCYAPVVTKTANGTFTRTWDWTIDKTGAVSDLVLSEGQQFLVGYEVTTTAAHTDSDFAVTGEIWVYNPATEPMTVTVADTLDDGTVATVDCGSGSAILTVAAGGSGKCTYEALPINAMAETNTATATLNGIAFTGSDDIDWTYGEVDECIDVTDDRFGFLGKVCADQAPVSFAYSLYVGPYAECGLYEFVNTASFVTNDTFATDSDSWTVTVNVPCAGCTLTQGYWKTHSKYGPAPYDDTWALIGEDTPFFLSGQTYYQVLQTSPAGNIYYNLAHQYIAAELNLLNGAASTAEVDAALAYAENLFSMKTPDQVMALKGGARNAVIATATILDNYNNGLTGPGYCSE